MSTETEHTQTQQADIEQRLRRELGDVTVRMPADMVDRAHRGYRRRVVITRATAVTGSVAVIAITATVLAMAAPLTKGRGGQPGHAASQASPPGAPPASREPQPPGNGLTAGQASRDIVWTRTLTPSASDHVTVTDQFGYAGTTRTIGYTASGSPSSDTLIATVNHSNGSQTVTRTDVGYTSRSWSRTASTGHRDHHAPTQQAICATARVTGVGFISAAALADSAGLLLACRGLTVRRGAWIEGIKAITISSDTGGGPATLWLNAATGVPIQLVTSTGPAGATSTTVQFGFLPPTRANLAYLSAFAVPAGFRSS